MALYVDREADASALDPSTAPILDAATKFLWNDEMQSSVDAFTRNFVPLFEGATGPDGEQRLEWTEAHREFSALWEFHLESFVESQPFDAAQFVSACQDALLHCPPRLVGQHAEDGGDRAGGDHVPEFCLYDGRGGAAPGLRRRRRGRLGQRGARGVPGDRGGGRRWRGVRRGRAATPPPGCPRTTPRRSHLCERAGRSSSAYDPWAHHLG